MTIDIFQGVASGRNDRATASTTTTQEANQVPLPMTATVTAAMSTTSGRTVYDIHFFRGLRRTY